jgi:hypothetical protein
MAPANTLAAPVADAPRALALSPELAGFAIQAKTMDDAMKLCDWLARSPLIPKAYQGNPAAIWTAGAMGQKLGVDLFTAMTGIASINGRPTIWGDLLRGLILANPQLEALSETSEGEGAKLVAVCTIKRRGMEPYTARYGIADAQAAGLLTKDTWKQYPADMCLNRAFARAARRRFADVLSGLSVAEEQDDVREVEAKVVDNVPEAKPAKAREVPADVGADAAPAPAEQPAAAPAPAAAAEKPSTPTSRKSLNEACISFASAFKQRAVDELKEINKALGIAKMQDCPEEKIPEALRLVKAADERFVAKLRAELQAAADAEAKAKAAAQSGGAA